MTKKSIFDFSSEISPKSRSENLLVQNSGDEILIYDTEISKAFCLNETAALIWRNCDGTNNIEDLINIVESKFTRSVDKDLVLFAIEELAKDNLITKDSYTPSDLSHVSRRDLIKKIGYSSMIAIPIISAIVAPNAVHAQSCVGMAANFPPGTQTAAGTISNCPTSNICDTQGANCCTAMATITCLAPGTGTVSFTCNCT